MSTEITSLNGYPLKDETARKLAGEIVVPTKLSELSEDTSHRLTTDDEKAAWNAKSDFSGSYNDLTGKPTIPTVPVKISAFDNDAGYLKEIPSEYVTETELVNKGYATTSQVNTKYTKPSSGIPKSDLDSAAQTSLGKADTALQSVPPTYSTTAQADAKYQPKGDYLTQHQSLAEYAKKTAVTAEITAKVNELKETLVNDISWLDGYDIPVLTLTGDTTGMSKDVEKTLTYSCKDKDGTTRTGSCTLKWQGSSSLAYDKKNYTIKLDTDLEMVDGWGAQKKYCLKANFIDHSHARNIICARLWGQMVETREGADARLNALPNYGAVDGFPIAIVLNGRFHGLYTWNIPKDKWMFGMGSGEKEAFVCADVYSDAVGFKALCNLQNDFELEYSSDGESEWVKESLNNLIQMVMDSDGSNINVIGQYLDWNSAIDYYIFTVLIEGNDNTKKNYILATYDGSKWFFSAYDMDSTFGLQWQGTSFLPVDQRPTFATRGEITSDKLMYLIWTYKREELRQRYAKLRATAFSESNVYMNYTNFATKIPSKLLRKDTEEWPSIPSTAVNNTAQILNYYRMRASAADEWIKDTNGEQELPEQGAAYTNLVPTSIDTDGSIFNETGYQDGKRLSSSGAVKDQSSTTVTGFMPFVKGDICRLTGIKLAGYGNEGVDGLVGGHGLGQGTGLYSYVGIYDASKTMLACFQPSKSEFDGKGIVASGWSYPVAQTTDIITLDFSNVTYANMAYIRLNGVGSGADMIVTKNQEIV